MAMSSRFEHEMGTWGWFGHERFEFCSVSFILTKTLNQYLFFIWTNVQTRQTDRIDLLIGCSIQLPGPRASIDAFPILRRI
jgi:hypothetical protein